MQDMGKRNWGYVQTYGKANVNQGHTSASVGDGFGTTGAVPGLGGTASPVLTTLATPASYGFAGFYMDDATADEEGVEVFVRCE